MDALRTAAEIGLFETAFNIERSGAGGINFPLQTSPSMSMRIGRSAQWLAGFRKETYMFLTSEIALIEAMKCRAFIAVPCGMDPEAEERLSNNLPASASIINEPYFPGGFVPKDSMIVICGFLAGGYAVIMNETFRLVKHYESFRGKKVFVPYAELEHYECPEGWKRADDSFSAIWRDAGC